jgi:hypothetical protein
MVLRCNRPRLTLIWRRRGIVAIEDSERLRVQTEAHVLRHEIQNAIGIIRKLNKVEIADFVLEGSSGESRQSFLREFRASSALPAAASQLRTLPEGWSLAAA